MPQYSRGALMNAPPRLSDLPPDDMRTALIDRHHANQEAWFGIHKEAGLTMRERITRALRRTIFNRRK
jgi:hypothetical protein